MSTVPASEWTVEVTRTLRVVVPATTHAEAREKGLDIAWDWSPEQAEGGDQGSASVRVVREPPRPPAPLVAVPLACGHEGKAPEEELHTLLFWCPECRQLRDRRKEAAP